MRAFKQEEIQKIELGGHLLLPTYFQDGTIGKELAMEVIKVLNNETVVEKEILDELIFMCYSNGAKIAPMTVVIPKESFRLVENFSKIVSEMTDHNFDKKLMYKSFLVLYLNNIINIYPEEAFANNFVVDKTWHYYLPPVTSIIYFIELIVDLIENNKPAFISFINYQDIRIEQIVTTKLKIIAEKEQKISEDLNESKINIQKLNLKNQELLEENERLVRESKNNIEKNKASIITIVSLIATIIPFFIVNLSVLVNSFNIILLLCINGMMCLIIGIIYCLVNKINKEYTGKYSKEYSVFITVGVILLVVGIVLWILAATVPTIKDFILLMKL